MNDLFPILGSLYNCKVYVVAQLVEALRYRPEGSGFDWNFLWTILLTALWPWDQFSLEQK
jgi:hypothetical protein